MTSRFAKFMNLKDFHPSNYQNQKKVWMAREKEKQKQKELEQLDREYQKEHGLLTVKYVNLTHRYGRWRICACACCDEAYKHICLSACRAMAPTADKNKLALSFMYNEPPGFAEGMTDGWHVTSLRLPDGSARD